MVLWGEIKGCRLIVVLLFRYARNLKTEVAVVIIWMRFSGSCVVVVAVMLVDGDCNGGCDAVNWVRRCGGSYAELWKRRSAEPC